MEKEQKTDNKPEFNISVGALIYDEFMKSGIAAKCTPQQWKDFEKKAMRLIYHSLGMDDVEDDLCTFTALAAAFANSLTIASLGQQALEELEKIKTSK